MKIFPTLSFSSSLIHSSIITLPTSPSLTTHSIFSSRKCPRFRPPPTSCPSPATATATPFFMASALRGGGSGDGSITAGFLDLFKPPPGFYISPFTVVCILLGVFLVSKKLFLWLIWNWFRAVCIGILAISLLENPITASISTLAAIVAAIQLLLRKRA